jgi:hypothetical protein
MASDEQRTPEQLKDFQRRIAMPSTYTLESHYREHLERCKLHPGFVPSPRMIQEFVAIPGTTWKQFFLHATIIAYKIANGDFEWARRELRKA